MVVCGFHLEVTPLSNALSAADPGGSGGLLGPRHPPHQHPLPEGPPPCRRLKEVLSPGFRHFFLLGPFLLSQTFLDARTKMGQLLWIFWVTTAKNPRYFGARFPVSPGVPPEAFSQVQKGAEKFKNIPSKILKSFALR